NSDCGCRRDNPPPLRGRAGAGFRAVPARAPAVPLPPAPGGGRPAAERARMAPVDAKPFPPGDYDAVGVGCGGSGPGGLQTSYEWRSLGIRHAVLSADDSPGGMFQRFPVYERLITWTKPDAPFARGT